MRKKLTAIGLALVLVLSLVPAALAAPAGVAKASTQSVEVDGAKIEFQMYALESATGLTNYVKLRDVAHVLNSTPARFSVGYDGTISITTGESYTDNGSEMTTPYSGDRAYEPGPGAVKVNGADVCLEAIVLKNDNGGAYTYFKLRDLGTALGFKVDWTGERGVFIETGAPVQTQPQTTSVSAGMELFQGAWLSPVLNSDKNGRYIEEWIITGNEIKLIQQYDSGALNWHLGTLNMQTNTAADGNGFPCKLEMTVKKTATKDDPEPRDRTKPQVGSWTINGFDPNTKQLTVNSGSIYQKVELSDSNTPNAAVQTLTEKLETGKENLKKYPLYRECPSVPDFGAMYGVSYDHAPSTSTTNMVTYYYGAMDASDRAIALGISEKYRVIEGAKFDEYGYNPQYDIEREYAKLNGEKLHG